MEIILDYSGLSGPYLTTLTLKAFFGCGQWKTWLQRNGQTDGTLLALKMEEQATRRAMQVAL